MPKKQGALPEWDKSDSFGDVHTVCPPELVIPSVPELMFMRADFNGVCLDLNYWGIEIDFNNNWLIGANSTPFNMLMTPMYPMYNKKIQDAGLTEHCWRNLSHFVVASQGWNMIENGFNWSVNQFVSWCQYLKSWGFFVVYWDGYSIINDEFLIAALRAKCIDFLIYGKEVDATVIYAEEYEKRLDSVIKLVAGQVPIATHFTANYPKGFPKSTFFDGRSMKSFGQYNQLGTPVHLCWQADQNNSAGEQGAMLYYARERVSIGGVEGDGIVAPDSLTFAFEIMATAELYGQCTEEYGNLRAIEMNYCTRRDDRIPAMAGGGNGFPDRNLWTFPS